MMTEKELEARLQIAAWMGTVTEPGIQAQEERRK